MSTMPGFPPNPPQQSSGGCGKMFMVLGCGCLLMLLLCGGVVGVIGYGINEVASSVSDDPQVADRLGKEILDWPYTQSLKPKGSIDAQVFGYKLGRGVVYEGDQGEAVILGQLQGEWISHDQLLEGLRNGAQGQQNKQQGERREKIINRKDVDVQIRGKSSPFTFTTVEAEEKNVKQQIWQVSGVVDDPDGPVMVFVILPHGDYEEEQIVELLQTIK